MSSPLSPFEQNFCGNRSFWDEHKIWEVDDPEFPICFHKTILSWAPAIVLFILSALEVGSYFSSPNRDIYLLRFLTFFKPT